MTHPAGPTCALVFEGGWPAGFLERSMATVRKAVVLDTLEKLRQVGDLDVIVLATNYPDLAADARALGVTVELNRLGPPQFQFGTLLAQLVRKYAAARVLYISGAAVPLVRVRELQRAVDLAREGDGVVVTNNVQSADLVAWSPAEALFRLPPPQADNELGYALRATAGLRRILLPNSPWINFDLDTPADVQILGLQPWAGPRTAAAVRSLAWDDRRLRAVQELLGRVMAEVALIGRVGAPIIAFLNAHFAVRLRVFSEERGMRAMGRVERGEVVSLLGRLMDRVGPEAFFADLAAVAHAALVDTRVFLAHWQKRLSDEERFAADLGLLGEVADPEVRRFVEAAYAAPIPVVLGGHSLVSGGIWVLAAARLAQEGRWTEAEDPAGA